MRWLRHRSAAPPLTGSALADTWQVCSLLLGYPDEQLVARVPMLREVVAPLPDEVVGGVRQLLDVIAARPLGELQADYVDTFDVTRKCSLHLTYFTHGDTRRRGVALVQFKQAYRHAGVDFDEDAAGGELPDYLPVVLEFGASVDAGIAWKLLNDHRVGLELLRTALQRRQSPWLGAVETVRATLPALDDDDQVALRRLIQQGPPSEEVGLGDLSLAPYSATGETWDDFDPAAELNPRPLPFPTAAEFGFGAGDHSAPSGNPAEGALR